MSNRKALLFVCVENSNRSQMAEAFARRHGGNQVDAWSAGSRPSGKVNPKAIAAMEERGIDLTSHRSKGLGELPDRKWDWVVTMGCGDECPMIKAAHRDDWALPDPRDLPPEEFARVRDEIERRVIALVSQTIEESPASE
jgi:arsenate reductase (thioredoxin)